MLKDRYPYYLANRSVQSNQELEVTDKYTGKVVSRVSIADKGAIDQAIGKAVEAAAPMRKMPAYRRQEILMQCLSQIEKRAEELAKVLTIEVGKPLKDSRAEVTRLMDTFRVAAEESVRIGGEVIPMDISARAVSYRGMWKRFPIGPCSFISPFNFPLNLVAHKVAPAIAVGCPFVLKPASRTPISALILGEILSETQLPDGAFSILPCPRDGAELFTEDERLKLLSFTGSPGVGWDLKARAGKKKVILELGGNAGVIVDEDADLEDAAQRIAIGAFGAAGQSCISVQRVIIHEKVYSQFSERLVSLTQKLKVGDPKQEDTSIGPMISEAEAKRLEGWIEQAQKKGARILCGGKRTGAVLEPTLLENVPVQEKVCAEEAFGPVAVLSKFRNFDDAISEINQSRFGLQAGVFTRDIYKAQRAWEELDVGGVIIGEIPSFRVDHMPYGGVKDSGLGREGVRFAMEEMTEIRMMVLRMR